MLTTPKVGQNVLNPDREPCLVVSVSADGVLATVIEADRTTSEYWIADLYATVPGLSLCPTCGKEWDTAGGCTELERLPIVLD